MRGTIKAYSLVVNAGIIEGDDGRTYDFPVSEWRGIVGPLLHGIVRFSGSSRSASEVSAYI